MTVLLATMYYDALIGSLSKVPRPSWSWKAGHLLRVPRETVIKHFVAIGSEDTLALILSVTSTGEDLPLGDAHLVHDDGSLWG